MPRKNFLTVFRNRSYVATLRRYCCFCFPLVRSLDVAGYSDADSAAAAVLLLPLLILLLLLPLLLLGFVAVAATDAPRNPYLSVPSALITAFQKYSGTTMLPSESRQEGEPSWPWVPVKTRKSEPALNEQINILSKKKS